MYQPFFTSLYVRDPLGFEVPKKIVLKQGIKYPFVPEDIYSLYADLLTFDSSYQLHTVWFIRDTFKRKLDISVKIYYRKIRDA